MIAACGPSDGVHTEHYNTGSKQEEGTIRNGEKSGKWVYYWRNGNVQTEGFYMKGEPDRRWTYYDEQGKKIAEGTYKGGKMWNGTFVRYVMGTKKFITIEAGKESGR
jgi:antitoxin component YwqK of YwqJK toxin-antitoxin module